MISQWKRCMYMGEGGFVISRSKRFNTLSCQPFYFPLNSFSLYSMFSGTISELSIDRAMNKSQQKAFVYKVCEGMPTID